MASPKHKKSKMRKRQRVAQLEKPILANVRYAQNVVRLRKLTAHALSVVCITVVR